MNPRPLGYEPNELPDCSIPRYSIYMLTFNVNEVHDTTALCVRQEKFIMLYTIWVFNHRDKSHGQERFIDILPVFFC